MRQIRNNDSSANSPNCFTTCHLCWGGIDLSYLYAKTLHGSTLLLAGSITELPDIGHSKNIHMMEMSQKPYIEMIFLSRSGYHIFNSKTLPIKVSIIIKYSIAFLKFLSFSERKSWWRWEQSHMLVMLIDNYKFLFLLCCFALRQLVWASQTLAPPALDFRVPGLQAYTPMPS